MSLSNLNNSIKQDLMNRATSTSAVSLKTINFGVHKGTAWTRLPTNYLRTIVDTYSADTFEHNMANKILELRNYETLEPMNITRHAVDRFSTRCLDIWKNNAKKDEGIQTYLHRMAVEARKKMPNQQEVIYKGVKFVFSLSQESPMLITVYDAKEQS